MRVCPICENDLEKCQCENKVYLVVWAEPYDCNYVDSIWSSRRLAEKRVELLKKMKRKKRKYFVSICEVKIDDYKLLYEFGGDGFNYDFGLVSF